MTISVNGAVPREDLNFSQIFLQQIVPHTFLHQSLGHRNFILQLSGKIIVLMNLTRQRCERQLCSILCRARTKVETLHSITYLRVAKTVRIREFVDRVGTR